MTFGWRLQLALGLLSTALIALQLVLMQILSITQWHHFAYLVIATALLGFGASGTLLSLTRSWCLRHSSRLLPLLMIACAIAMATLGWLTQGLLRNFDSYLLFFAGEQSLRLLAIILCSMLPFLLGAMAIGLLFIRHIEQIGSLYFANLLGSGVGGIFGLGLLWLLPAEQLPALLALVTLSAGILCIPRSSRLLQLAALLGSIATGAAFLFPAQLALSQYKDLTRALNLPQAQIVARRPSPYGLVETVSAPAIRYAPGLSLNYTGQVPIADAVFNNGNFLGAILPQPAAAAPHLLAATTGALPFAIARPEKVLILQAGTGTEVGLALSQGAKQVVAVQPHTALLELLRDEYRDELGYLFEQPAVSIENLAPRTFLARESQLYDLIMLPTVGSFGGNLGLFALQEQNSLTLEGLSGAWQQLQPEGLLCVNSWLDFPLRAPLRLATSLGQMLERQGVAEPQKQVVAVRSWGTVSLCAKRSPLTESELERLLEFSRQQQFDIVLPATPDAKELNFNSGGNENLEELLPLAVSPGRQRLVAAYPFNIAPTDDDRPFFAQFLRWRNLPQLAELFGGQRLPFLELGYLIAIITVLQLSLAADILILLPLLKLGWRQGQRCWTLIYFGSLGIGFMLVELSLIHRFILYLGNPVYSAGTIICVLLICSGCGSYLSSRYSVSNARLKKLCAALAGLLLIYSLVLPLLLAESIAIPFAARGMMTLLLLAPVGLVMG